MGVVIENISVINNNNPGDTYGELATPTKTRDICASRETFWNV